VLSLAQLKKAGFSKSGVFLRFAGTVSLSGVIPDNPGVYRFVIDRNVRYVGKAEGSLRRRLRGYENGLRKRLVKRPVHKGILETLDGGKNVDVYTLTFTIKQQLFYRKGLPVDYLVGVEAGLIDQLDEGHWNPFGSAIKAKRAKLRRDS
jgi:hypothetical protein